MSSSQRCFVVALQGGTGVKLKKWSCTPTVLRAAGLKKLWPSCWAANSFGDTRALSQFQKPTDRASTARVCISMNENE